MSLILAEQDRLRAEVERHVAEKAALVAEADGAKALATRADLDRARERRIGDDARRAAEKAAWDLALRGGDEDKRHNMICLCWIQSKSGKGEELCLKTFPKC